MGVRTSRLRFAAGILASSVLGWFAFVREGPVPLLSLADLGFHELGHLVAAPLPALITAMAGSIAQVGVPLGVASYFFLRRGDGLAGGMCLAWASTSAQNVSVYIADAPHERLPLIGGMHDWAYILGPEHLDALDRAGAIAAAVNLGGVALLGAALVITISGLLAAPAPAWQKPALGPGPGLDPWTDVR